MRLLVEDGTIWKQFAQRRQAYGRWFNGLVLAAVTFTETQGWAVFGLISILCGWTRMSRFGIQPLDHDELYTFYIAQTPSLEKLLELTRTVDLHPPLSYLLIRAAFAVFGAHIWVCRLPSVLAFFFTTGLVFWFLKRILSPSYGLMGVLLVWISPFSYHAEVARPYSLLLFFTTLMLIGWFRATQESSRRGPALAAITLAGFGMLLSHVLAVFVYASFLAAEVVRFWSRRKPDWRLLLLLLLPAVSVITYLPLMRNRAGILFAHEYCVTPLRLFSCYWEYIRYAATPLALIAVLCAIGLVRKKEL